MSSSKSYINLSMFFLITINVNLLLIFLTPKRQHRIMQFLQMYLHQLIYLLQILRQRHILMLHSLPLLLEILQLPIEQFIKECKQELILSIFILIYSLFFLFGLHFAIFVPSENEARCVFLKLSLLYQST